MYTTYVYTFVRYFAWISQVWVSEPCFVSMTLIVSCDRILVGGVDVLVSTHRQPSSMECRSWLIWQTVSAQVEIISVEFILMMRGEILKISTSKLSYLFLC